VSVAAVIEGEPVVRPMTHARLDDDLILHGHHRSRFLAHLVTGAPVCINALLLDGIVLGRTIQGHGFNYRSVIVHGCGRPISDAATKRDVLRRVFDHIAPNRWDLLRRLDDSYVSEIALIRVPLVECVAKVREGMPDDWSASREPAVWAGVVPLTLTRGQPEGDW
jgi:uncharacterized protein